MSKITWERGVEDLVSSLAKFKQPAWSFTTRFILEHTTESRSERKSKMLALFVLQAPVIFPFLTDYEKMYLIQWFVNVETSIKLKDRDKNLCNPSLAPMIRFAMLCKETYLKGNITPRLISDGELDVLPRREGHLVRNPTRRETISMLKDLYRLGGAKRRLSSWRDPINRTVRRIFIIACRKDQIKFVVGDLLSLILCHLWEAVYPL